ncbi:MAG: hypothetical protein U0S36_13010 [Candidatus Nanopelagicales bacterium]
MSTRLRTSLVALAVVTALAVPTAAAARTTTAASPSGGTTAALRAVDGRARVVAAEQPATTHAPSRTSATPTARRTSPAPRVTIRHYVDAPGSQRQIDRCRLVLWTSRPMWLAGHNYCGYQWLASVRTGTTVVVTAGRAAGRYVVTGHLRLARQSGSLPRVHADLVLQTCVGRSTGLTLARRVR